LILGHLFVVYDIARSIRAGLPACVNLEDLVGAGMLGLVDAARKFDLKKRTAFGTYAKHRIRGAIYDELRALDPLSRDMRRKQRAAEHVVHELTGNLGRGPTEEEIACALRLPLKGWWQLSQKLYQAGCPGSGFTFSDEAPTIPENLPAVDGNPERRATQSELRWMLEEVIHTLPPRYQMVLALYYRCGWAMKRIGHELGINESRISQMHAWALAKMRLHLETRGYSCHAVLAP
jgi:RNA polymerase sigma factor for flagellar operon FliA